MASVNKKQQLHSGHRARMRKRFDVGGMTFDGFHEHEILETVLFSCFSRCNTNEMAHELINRFGSLENVFNASATDMQEIPGVGEKASRKLQIYGEILRHCDPENAETGELDFWDEIMYEFNRQESK